jgi:hypothetical protein
MIPRRPYRETMAQDESFGSLDARILLELKRLIRAHRITVDPADASFDVVRTGVQDNRQGLSGPEAHRYWQIAEEAWQVHSGLTTRAGTYEPAVEDFLRRRALRLIQNIASLADEPPPVRLPEERFSRLVMYFLPLVVAPAGLALLLYRPSSEASIIAGVAIANIGFGAAVWSWRVRFEKWPGARSLWTFVAIYMVGLTLAEVLVVFGLIRPL